MVDDSKNLKDKIFAYKGLGMIGSADIIGAAITGIFWLSIASFIEECKPKSSAEIINFFNLV